MRRSFFVFFRKKSQLVSLTKRDVAASLRESPNEPPCMHFPYPCALKKGNRIFHIKGGCHIKKRRGRERIDREGDTEKDKGF